MLDFVSCNQSCIDVVGYELDKTTFDIYTWLQSIYFYKVNKPKNEVQVKNKMVVHLSPSILPVP